MLRLVNKEPLSRIVQHINVNHIISAASDIKSGNSNEEAVDYDKFASAAITNIMDDLGSYTESRVIESLRLNPYWQKTLEQLRKDRIRNSGGKLIFHASGEVEIDKNGISRPIPHADELIDTDIFHGSIQRMHINVVLPELVKKREAVELKDAELNGELACLIQFGYESVVIALQRVTRRWLVRLKRRVEIRSLIWLGINSSATLIQASFPDEI